MWHDAPRRGRENDAERRTTFTALRVTCGIAPASREDTDVPRSEETELVRDTTEEAGGPPAPEHTDARQPPPSMPDRPPQTVLLSLYLAMADLRRLNAA